MSWFQDYLAKFKATPGNDCDWVTVEPYAGTGPGWRLIGVHRLSEAENALLRHVFLAVLDEKNERVKNALVSYSWDHIKPEEEARLTPVVLDKPEYEPWGNIPLNAGQNLSVWVQSSLPSDKVYDLLMSGDPRVPHNPNLHGSYLVVFRYTPGGEAPPPDEDEDEPPVEPPVEPPDTGWPPGVPSTLQAIEHELANGAQMIQAGQNKVLDALMKVRSLLPG